MERIFERYLRHGEEPKIRHVLNQAMPYIDESFEGEAILSVGKSIDFIHKGASGIINAMPFTCMPGTVSSAIMKLIQNKYDVPVINVAYDGQGETNITTRLEAFMHQVNRVLQERSGAGQIVRLRAVSSARRAHVPTTYAGRAPSKSNANSTENLRGP